MHIGKDHCLGNGIVQTTLSQVNTHLIIEVRCTDLLPVAVPQQISLFGDQKKMEKQEALDRVVETLRGRFGHTCILRVSVMTDAGLGSINPKGDHVIHPVAFFKGATVL